LPESVSPVVKQKLLQQIFPTQSGEEKWGFPSPQSVGEKWVFTIDSSADPMQSKQLALITGLFG
jgi:hypothetical protein